PCAREALCRAIHFRLQGLSGCCKLFTGACSIGSQRGADPRHPASRTRHTRPRVRVIRRAGTGPLPARRRPPRRRAPTSGRHNDRTFWGDSMSANSYLTATLASIRAVDPLWIEKARERQLQLTKPSGSLGRLEEVANRIAAIQQTLNPAVAQARIAIFAADH